MLKLSWKQINGFTLLELAVAFAVIAVLTSLTFPSMTQTVARLEARTEFNDILQRLQNARIHAIVQNKKIAIDLEQMTYAHVHVSWAMFPKGNILWFLPSGLTDNQNATITVTSSSHFHGMLRVSQGARVREELGSQ